MIVFNGMDLMGLAVMLVLLVICGVILVIDRIAYAVKKHHQSSQRSRGCRKNETVGVEKCDFEP